MKYTPEEISKLPRDEYLREVLLGGDPDHEEKRRYVEGKLRELDPSTRGFSYTDGNGPPWPTKEELWEEIKKSRERIDRGEYTELDFNDSNVPGRRRVAPTTTGKPKVDLAEWVKQFKERKYD